MERRALEAALSVTRRILYEAITTASYNGKIKSDGQEAKNAAIRSSGPIQQVHTVVRDSIHSALNKRNMDHKIWPPPGKTSPELKVTGLLKAKKQDVAVTIEPHAKEVVGTGVNKGLIDSLGLKATNSSLVIGVRSQLSSLDKNFDTLAERAFAETLNLRLRAPRITLGEVYLLPVCEFDDDALKRNEFDFRKSKIDLEKFIRIFNAITGDPSAEDLDSLYKYNQTALVIADFSQTKVKVLWTESEVAQHFGKNAARSMLSLLPSTFTERIVQDYLT